MKNKQKKIYLEVKRLLHTAMDTADWEEAEDICVTEALLIPHGRIGQGNVRQAKLYE